MITGYNHNIKYQDSVCHIQTEDSGRSKGHIITHLFVGGNIIETRKVSYADIADNDDAEPMIIELMQNQHKGMLKDLIKGRLDEQLAARSVNAATLDGPAPLNVDAGGQHRTSFGFPSAAPAKPAEPAPAEVPAPKPAAAPTPTAPPVKPVEAPVQAASPFAIPPPTPVPSRLPASQPERVIPEPVESPSLFELPPVSASPVFPELPEIPATPAFSTDAESLASSITSSFFGDAPPPEQIIEAETLQAAFDSPDESAIDSIFGEDLISEKSLDEVILSYLAEDMQKE